MAAYIKTHGKGPKLKKIKCEKKIQTLLENSSIAYSNFIKRNQKAKNKEENKEQNQNIILENSQKKVSGNSQMIIPKYQKAKLNPNFWGKSISYFVGNNLQVLNFIWINKKKTLHEIELFKLYPNTETLYELWNMSESQFAKIKLKLSFVEVSINKKFNLPPQIFHQIFPNCQNISKYSEEVGLSSVPPRQLSPSQLIPADYTKGSWFGYH